jgi:hypothetical protein
MRCRSRSAPGLDPIPLYFLGRIDVSIIAPVNKQTLRYLLDFKTILGKPQGLESNRKIIGHRQDRNDHISEPAILCPLSRLFLQSVSLGLFCYSG